MRVLWNSRRNRYDGKSARTKRKVIDDPGAFTIASPWVRPAAKPFWTIPGHRQLGRVRAAAGGLTADALSASDLLIYEPWPPAEGRW